MQFQRQIGFLISLTLVCVCHGKVLDSFDSCKRYFYKGTVPQTGFEGAANTAYICQQLDNVHRFATLYNKNTRIPVYSAYLMEATDCKPGPPPTNWFIEPQLQIPNGPPDMEIVDPTEAQKYKESQAIDADYKGNTGRYTRGHTNPDCYHTGNDTTATYTLTNVVPQTPESNNGPWSKAERKAMNYMNVHCKYDNMKRYFITGATPSNPAKTLNDTGRVNIPTVMWTAACCDASEANEPKRRFQGFSFGYFGYNNNDKKAKTTWKFVEDIESLIKNQYNPKLNQFKIFPDDCFKDQKVKMRVAKDLDIKNNLDLAEKSGAFGIHCLTRFGMGLISVYVVFSWCL